MINWVATMTKSAVQELSAANDEDMDLTDMPFTILHVIKDLMESGIRVWIYSGDTNAKCSVTSTKLSINKLKTSLKMPLYPRMYEGEADPFAKATAEDSC
ncbi:serine carboxypeptidase 1 [Tanacetum coccineum]